MALNQPSQPITPTQSANALVTAKAQGVNPPPPPPPQTDPRSVYNSVVGKLINGIAPTAVPTPTPIPFTPVAAPAPAPALMAPTAQVPGITGLSAINAGAVPMMQALEQQTTQMAKSGKLTGMPNYGALWSGLGAAQNAVNNGSFTPAEESGAAGTGARMATEAAMTANQLAQRQTQEYNQEQANAQRMGAMLLSSARTANVSNLGRIAPYLMQMLLAGQMAGKSTTAGQ